MYIANPLNRPNINLFKERTLGWYIAIHSQFISLKCYSLTGLRPTRFPTFVFSTSVRDLGIILDQELSFVEHITARTRSCFYHLLQLRVGSRSLSASSTATIIHAFIVNRLYHFSSLYFFLPHFPFPPL